MGAQKDITVRDDFELSERIEIYKTYLMFCMTGDVVQLPMGGTIVVERDEQEFARLSQLGDVLGLGPRACKVACGHRKSVGQNVRKTECDDNRVGKACPLNTSHDGKRRDRTIYPAIDKVLEHTGCLRLLQSFCDRVCAVIVDRGQLSCHACTPWLEVRHITMPLVSSGRMMSGAARRPIVHQ